MTNNRIKLVGRAVPARRTRGLTRGGAHGVARPTQIVCHVHNPKKFLLYITLFGLIISEFLNSAVAQTNFTIFKSCNLADGAVPVCGMVADTNGLLYGSTAAGGISNMGTIFITKPDGTGFKTLKSFIGTDGSAPRGTLVLSTNGFLYGVTYSGGVSNSGTVFGIGRDGNGFTNLHSFIGNSDGKNPQTGLIEGIDGVLYGTTYFANSSTRGTVFKINKDGSGYSVIHNFTGNPDGQQPNGRLLEADDGMLYGTTPFGGTTIAGTIYSLQKDGNSYSILYVFKSVAGDGYGPGTGLIEASDHVLYGTAGSGGAGSVGTIYKINKGGGGYQTIYSFSATGNNANKPLTELFEGTDGVFYGGTQFNGSQSNGALYKINKDGSGYALLRSFLSAGGDGQTPFGPLTRLTNGIFYGTTGYGGANEAGCIFALSTNVLSPRFLSLSPLGSSNLLQFIGTSFVPFDIQRTTNFLSWSNLGTLTCTNGSFSYLDLNQPMPVAFYRIQQH